MSINFPNNLVRTYEKDIWTVKSIDKTIHWSGKTTAKDHQDIHALNKALLQKL